MRRTPLTLAERERRRAKRLRRLARPRAPRRALFGAVWLDAYQHFFLGVSLEQLKREKADQPGRSRP